MKANRTYIVMVSKTLIGFKSLQNNSHFESEMTGTQWMHGMVERIQFLKHSTWLVVMQQTVKSCMHAPILFTLQISGLNNRVKLQDAFKACQVV